MTRTDKAAILGAAIGALIAAGANAQVHPEKPVYKYEKCYGISKAGKNDCFTARNSCAGTVATDDDPIAWIYVPKGTCERITGGSMQPPRE